VIRKVAAVGYEAASSVIKLMCNIVELMPEIIRPDSKILCARKDTMRAALMPYSGNWKVSRSLMAKWSTSVHIGIADADPFTKNMS
jgi:hypothetical protein